MNKPTIDPTAFIAPGAAVRGNVVIGPQVSVWYNAVIRSTEDEIRIGEGSNIQDNAVVHLDKGHQVTIGRQVTVGHGAIVHGCTIGDNTLIGMGAIILNDAKIGNNCIIGAGALVTQGKVIPDNSLVLGSPGKVVRQVTPAEILANTENALHYRNELLLYAEAEREAK
jgi:carbonic anhydrase/acetyltransferase-like protein (isoleucine patch superfamily)